MRSYEFRLVLSGSPELTFALSDRLYEAGCDDGSPGSCDQQTFVDFDREAPSLEEAIRSAIANVGAAGCAAAKVEIDASELAAT